MEGNRQPLVKLNAAALWDAVILCGIPLLSLQLQSEVIGSSGTSLTGLLPAGISHEQPAHLYIRLVGIPQPMPRLFCLQALLNLLIPVLLLFFCVRRLHPRLSSAVSAVKAC